MTRTKRLKKRSRKKKYKGGSLRKRKVDELNFSYLIFKSGNYREVTDEHVKIVVHLGPPHSLFLFKNRKVNTRTNPGLARCVLLELLKQLVINGSIKHKDVFSVTPTQIGNITEEQLDILYGSMGFNQTGSFGTLRGTVGGVINKLKKFKLNKDYTITMTYAPSNSVKYNSQPLNQSQRANSQNTVPFNQSQNTEYYNDSLD